MICALLVIAGSHKLREPLSARESLALIHVPAPGLALRALGAAEVALGVVAAVRPTALTGSLVAVVYASFCGFVVVLLVRKSPGAVDCGCFGGSEQRVGWLHVALNGIACAIAAASAIVSAHGIGWILSQSALVAPSLVIGMLAATYAAYLAYTLVPQAWSSYTSGAAR